MIKHAHQQFADKILALLMWEAESKGFTPADLADAVGGAPRTFENYKYSAAPTFAGFLGIIRTVRPAETMKKLADQADGFFVQLTFPCDDSPPALTKLTSDIMKETSDVIKVVADSLRDGTVTPIEKDRITREINDAVEALLRARYCLKEHIK